MKRRKKGYLGVLGCLASIAVETLTAAICIKVLDMDEVATYSAVFAMLCIFLAFVFYYDNDYNEQIQKKKIRKKAQAEKKIGVGCFLIPALFFFILACLPNTRNKRENTPNRESIPTPSKSDTTAHKTKTNTGKVYQIETIKDDDEQDDDDLDEDPYDNPDFDDLFPGEEYDEEFLDSKGDPELYDEP